MGREGRVTIFPRSILVLFYDLISVLEWVDRTTRRRGVGGRVGMRGREEGGRGWECSFRVGRHTLVSPTLLGRPLNV